jgi:hypothetical protein
MKSVLRTIVYVHGCAAAAAAAAVRVVCYLLCCLVLVGYSVLASALGIAFMMTDIGASIIRTKCDRRNFE